MTTHDVPKPRRGAASCPYAALAALAALATLASCATAPEPVATTTTTTTTTLPPSLADLIGKGDVTAIQQQFGNRETLDKADAEGMAPLHRAVLSKSPRIVELLLALGAKVDPLDPKGRSPLRLAVDQGSADCAAPLAAKGAALFAKDATGSILAEAAIAKGGAMVDAVFGRATVNSRGPDGATALHYAAAALSEEAVARLLAAGADVQLRTNAGRSALDQALLKPDRLEAARIAETLVLRGVSPSFAEFAWFAQAARAVDYGALRFEDGNTPLHEAVIRKQKGFVQLLVAKKAPVNARNTAGSTPLHEAVRAGWLEGAEILLAGGADANARDGFDNTPLHVALPEAGREAGVALLLKYGADPSLKDRNGNTPLHVAVQVGYAAVLVQSLLSAGSPVNATNASGDTALVMSVRSGRYEYAPPLLQKGGEFFIQNLKGESALSLSLLAAASSPAPTPEGRLAALAAVLTKDNAGLRDNQGNTPLALAVSLRASGESIAFIVGKGGDANARNNAGDAPLHLAVRQGLRAQGEALLAARADIYSANVKGETPLSLALTAKTGFVDWLFDSQTIATRDKNGDGVLHHAARRDLARGIEYLGQKGADASLRNADGKSPLALAVEADALDSVKALIALGSPLSSRDAMGQTPLHAAVAWGSKRSLATLVTAGAELDARDFAGESALHQAVRRKDAESLRFLLQSGASTRVRDLRGQSPLAFAARTANPDLVAILLQAGSPIDERDASGKTALLLAVDQGDLETCRVLVGGGASLLALDIDGEMPLTLAAKRSLSVLEALLVPATANLPDSAGRSPLRILIEAKPTVEIVELALAKGTVTASRDREGVTVLHAALRARNLAVAKRLAEAGAELFEQDRNGESPLSIAIAAGPDALDAILGTGRLARRDAFGNGPLHYAALLGSTQAADWMVAAGADKSLRNIAGESAADVAAKRGFAELAAKLK